MSDTQSIRIFAIISLIMIAIAACQPDPPSISMDDLPEGDAGSGEKLFIQSINDTPACVTCHVLTDVNQVGPGLAGYGAIAGERVGGQSAFEYTYESVVQPSKHIVQGFSNVMYSDYDEKLEDADVADLIAYLLSL